MSFTVLDAYFHCCGERYDSRDDLREHQLSHVERHMKEILRIVKQHDDIWKILRRENKHLEMRQKLDALED